MHSLPVGCTYQLSPVNLAPKFFSPPWGCTCAQCTPGYTYAVYFKVGLSRLHCFTIKPTALADSEGGDITDRLDPT